MLSKHIVHWYNKNKRDLPWRDTHDPYFIWLSEIILQQTRVEQGLPYYLNFTEKFQTIQQLASAKDEDVMKMWQGLGYYNRAANMLTTARLVVSAHHSRFPESYDELLKLKGVGTYTAAAIASFAFNKRHAVVDGNVSRVLSRIFAIDAPVNSSKGKKIFENIANEILDKKHPGIFNQAMMELGAMVCKPQQPLCGDCPVRLHCMAYRKKNIGEYPVKIKKNKARNLYLNYFFIEQNHKIFIRQRTGSDIWKGLFELPNTESAAMLTEKEILETPDFKRLFGSIVHPQNEKIFSVKHQLTHQTIYATFYRLSAKKKIKAMDESCFSVEIEQLGTYAVPRLFDKFLNYLNLHSNQ